MKKKVLGLALIAMSLMTVNSVAQTNANNNTCPANKENVQCKKAPDNGKCKPACPFEGLNLTDAQKNQLKQLDTKREAARAEKKKEMKAEKQRRDSAKVADRRNAKKSYLAEIKSILTPEQYVTFLENSFMNGGQYHDKAFKQGKPGKDGKGMRHHGDRKGKDGKGKDGKRNHAHRNAKSMNNTPASNS